jgi:hypothetical protein
MDNIPSFPVFDLDNPPNEPSLENPVIVSNNYNK